MATATWTWWSARFYSRTALVYLGDGRGSFRMPPQSAPKSAAANCVAAGLQWGRSSQTSPASTTGEVASWASRWGDGRGNFVSSHYPAGQYPSQMRVPPTLTGMGFLDLVFGNQGTNSFTVCLNSGTGTMMTPVTYLSRHRGTTFIAAVPGDFAEDGRTDLVMDGWDGHLSLFYSSVYPVHGLPPRSSPPNSRHRHLTRANSK